MPNIKLYDQLTELIESNDISDIISSIMFYYKNKTKIQSSSDKIEDKIGSLVVKDLYELFRNNLEQISFIYGKHILEHFNQIQPLINQKK